MLQNRSYESVTTYEETPPPQPVALTLGTAGSLDDEPSTPPPPYSALYIPLPVDANEPPEPPPSYNLATMKLPTYQEVEERKTDISNVQLTLNNGSVVELGSDCIFASCFLMAFVFNWIGFLAGYCMTKTIAGRYGAIAGFGLSVVKWSLIIKSASQKNLLFGSMWVWWVLVAAGWLVFMRGVLVYLHIKLLVKRRRGVTQQYSDDGPLN